ncbi:MAG: protein-export membrane protein SecF [Candidatus Woykebacteria bacterium RIFCSPHIGHO2_02_FULL_43_16b]|uniref:Protein-export membrane protein SecF n=1 Tax=Candidatus Woykebacteria bacterium RIFCSPHIGHO2_02_FULL_43_16b TaxID=1802601 RepID=A0A1G1WRR6_9BACT|nr:MAG: protein-export membrane protein SecF [Candidatus Woykebacteria bacterium RIFCSPHIGHO2_02_FULL_43_16b]
MNIIGQKYIYFAISAILIIPGIISLSLYGLRLGIDFQGGTLLELKLEKAAPGVTIDSTVENQEKSNVVSSLQNIVEVNSISKVSDQSYLLRTKVLDKEKVTEVKAALETNFGQVEQKRVETVGPTIGKELVQNSLISLILASVAIVFYIAFSFREVPKPASSWKFGLTAIAALLHDVLFVVGVFSILGKLYNVEVDSLFVTALLTIIGFSVHDTIVVYDRIRENLKRRLPLSFAEVVNKSIIETIGRSVATSLTVVLVLSSLLLFGGQTIKWFVVALLVGIVSGTYSSIFNASPLLVVWQEWSDKSKK